jgi:hypothetical protein
MGDEQAGQHGEVLKVKMQSSSIRSLIEIQYKFYRLLIEKSGVIMEPAFWHKRWADNQIGFHQAQVNPYLQTYWPQLQLAPASRVLVPLCGKSLDLAWLAGQGTACLVWSCRGRRWRTSSVSTGLTPREQQGAFEVWRSGDRAVVWRLLCAAGGGCGRLRGAV